MKPIFSEQDRTTAVTNFISARYQGRVKIISWKGVADYLNGKRVRILNSMKPKAVSTYRVVGSTEPVYVYGEWQA